MSAARLRPQSVTVLTLSHRSESVGPICKPGRPGSRIGQCRAPAAVRVVRGGYYAEAPQAGQAMLRHAVAPATAAGTDASVVGRRPLVVPYRPV